MRARMLLVVAGLALGGVALAQEGTQGAQAQGTPAQGGQETLKAEVVSKKDAAAAPAASGAAMAAGSTVCTNGKNRRIVELQPGDKAAKTPCTVHYKKETEQPGHDQVLWTSSNDEAFCATKAQAFVDKLSGWGWACGK